MNTNKKLTILIIIVLTVAIILATAGVTYAIWQSRSTVENDTDFDIERWNETALFMVYAPLDENLNLISGSVTLSQIKALAVVGYFGLIDAVIIPPQFEITLGGQSKLLPVKKVLDPEAGTTLFKYGGVYSGDLNIKFENNRLIRALTIPASVTYIGSSVFQSMINLTSLTFEPPAENEANEELVIGNYAFLNCEKLNSYTSGRGLSYNVTAFLGTGIN